MSRNKSNRPIAFEALEERTFFSISYPSIASALATKLSDLQNAMNGIDNPNNRLPVIDKALHGIPEVTNVFSSFKNQLVSALNGLGSQASELDVRNAVFGALGPGGFNILADQNGNGVDADDVLISNFAPDNGNVTIQVDLAKHFNAGSSTFGFGLDNLPIGFETGGEVSVGVDFAYNDFTFGSTAGAFTFSAPAANELQIGVSGSIDASMTGHIGFLSFSAQDVGDPSIPDVHVLLSANVNNNGTITGAQLSGGADAIIGIQAVFGASASAGPSIMADLHLNWQLNTDPKANHSVFGSAPQLAFENVSMSLGSVMSEVVAPVVDVIQKVTKPIQPLFDALQEPIPVLSDLYHLVTDPDEDISITDLARLAVQSGQLPAGYYELAVLGLLVVDLNTLVNNVQSSPDANNLIINFGDYSLDDIASGDLRSLSPLAGDASNLSVATLQPDFDLGAVASSFNFDGLINTIDGLGIPGLGDALDNLAHRADSGVQYSFPLIDNPAQGVLSLLLGSDTDLFNFQASVFEPNADRDGIINLPLPIGLDFHLDAKLDIDAKLEIGYDTRGLREFFGSENPADLLNGFYIGKDTHFHLGGGFDAVANFDSAFFDFGLSGGIHANINIATNPAADVDGDQKIRFSSAEMGNTMFTASGAISLDLSAFVRVGVEVAGEFIGVEEDFEIASTDIVSFNVGTIANPFLPPAALQLANDTNTASLFSSNDDDFFVVTDPSGVLILNIGDSRAGIRGHEPGVTKETFVVFQGQLPPGVNPNSVPVGDVVTVTAFGFTQTYAGVKKIIAFGGTDNDVIVVKDGITAPVEMYGEAGNDRLVSQSTGDTFLSGGQGNDSLTVTLANATLDGGTENDQLFAGTGTNTLLGDFGDDLMVGADDGQNNMYGDRGNDTLVAGNHGDLLDGGGENDDISTGAGNDTVSGGRGDDHINWLYGNGMPRIDGGDGRDSVGLVGSASSDTFTINRDLIGGYELAILAPAASGGTVAVLAKNAELIGIEGGQAQDNITVNDVTNTSVQDIAINTGDVLHLDSAVDHVTVNGTKSNDTMNVKREMAVVQYDDHQKPVFGGIMQVLGLPNYTVHAANVQDDLVVRALEGNDTVTISSLTGPTRLEGNQGNDHMGVISLATDAYNTQLNVDAGADHNSFLFASPGVANVSLTLTDATVVGNMIPPGANYYATGGGDYSLGVTVSTGGGSDAITIRSTLPSTTTAINTAGGNDTVTLSSDGSGAGSLSDIRSKLQVNVGAGASNVVKLIDAGSTSGNSNVRIDAQTVQGFAGGADDSTIAYSASGGSLTLDVRSSNTTLDESFRVESPAAQLLITANGGRDTFNVLSLSRPTKFDAGSGDDVVNIGDGTHSLSQIQGTLAVNAGDGADQIKLTDQAAISGAGFSLTESTVTRSGAAPISYNAAEQVSIDATKFADTIVVQAMPAAVVGINSGAGSDALVGPNAANTWALTSPDKGALNSTFRYAAVESLSGGTQIDNFVFNGGATVSGNLIGDSGTDSLDYSAYSAVTVDLTASKASGVIGSIFNFENVVGSQKDDVIVGDAGINKFFGKLGSDVLVGGAGADHLFGDAGRDLLIGGVDGDTIAGGSDDDILIDGTTAHDANLASLALIMNEWRRTDLPALQRIAHLRNGGGLNGAVLLNAGTVLSDNAIDQLQGDADADWFWVKSSGASADTIVDLQAIDQVN